MEHGSGADDQLHCKGGGSMTPEEYIKSQVAQGRTVTMMVLHQDGRQLVTEAYCAYDAKPQAATEWNLPPVAEELRRMTIAVKMPPA